MRIMNRQEKPPNPGMIADENPTIVGNGVNIPFAELKRHFLQTLANLEQFHIEGQLSV